MPDIPAWLRTRLLFALILTAALAFGVRFNDLMSTSQAQEADPASLSLAALEPAAGETPAEGETEVIKARDPEPETPPPAPEEQTDAAPDIDWRDATDNDIEYSSVQMKLFEDLSKRRTELEEREKELATREALLQAAEKNLEQKYKELSDLKAEVQDILQEQDEAEKARITSLVKIYEGMKAKDAARIFDSLDMDVLLGVLGKMSERKSAPIIAAMNPERARSVTIMLAEQKALPTLDDDLSLQ